MSAQALAECERRMVRAQMTFGPFASAHEALGVALEEWTELIGAVQANDMESVKHEALDLAAVLIRLHDQADNIKHRSTQRC